MKFLSILLVPIAAACLTGCATKAPTVQATTADGTSVLLHANGKWSDDPGEIAESAGQVVVCGVVGTGPWDGILASERLVALGKEMGIEILTTAAPCVQTDQLADAAGILLRADPPYGVRWELLNQVAAGRRGIIFIDANKTTEETRAWLRDILDVSVLPSKGGTVLDGRAIAWFGSGLEVDLGSYWQDSSFEMFTHSEVVLGDAWSQAGRIDGKVFSAFRPWGMGELIISATGTAPNHSTPATPFDDGAMLLGDNHEMATQLLAWLAEPTPPGHMPVIVPVPTPEPPPAAAMPVAEPAPEIVEQPVIESPAESVSAPVEDVEVDTMDLLPSEMGTSDTPPIEAILIPADALPEGVDATAPTLDELDAILESEIELDSLIEEGESPVK